MNKEKAIRLKIKGHIARIKDWKKQIDRAEDRIKTLSDELVKCLNIDCKEG